MFHDRQKTSYMREEQPGEDRVDAQEESSPGGDQIPDRFYRALSAADRRRCLWYLIEQSDESDVRELANVLAGWEASDTGSMSTESDHADVLLELHHRHLPLLDDAGLIEYDSDSGAVDLDDLNESARDRLAELLPQDDDQAG